jgi:glyoxylase-like metal-dependent hydrolase (beta-lactamase superfamily II)
MRVHCLTTGRLRQKRRGGPARYLPGGWAAETLPVNAFAVEHPLGICLFDTGQTARAARPGYHQRWHPYLWLSRFELAPEEEAAPQLTLRGLDPSAVRWVVLSHLHTDHVGGLEAFRDAEVLASRAEWELARGVRGRLRGYIPQRWPHRLEPSLVELEGPSVGPFPRSHDVAGDGSLVLVPTPGHTRGHLGMLVDGDAARVLLGGDLAHTAAELAAVAPEVAAWCEHVLLAHDRDAADR